MPGKYGFTVEFYLKNVLNLYLPYDVALIFLDIYSKEKMCCSNKPLYTDVHGYFIYNSQTVETPINRLVDKQVLYIHAMWCYSAIEKNEVLIHALI